MAKINKELVQPPYKLSIANSLILSISFNTISSVINEHIKRGITSTKHCFSWSYIRRIML